MLDLKSYAETFRVPLVPDECDELIIPGHYGHIYAHSATQLGWCLTNTKTARLKHAVIRRYVQTGRAVLHGEGDTEAIILFDPGDAALFANITCVLLLSHCVVIVSARFLLIGSLLV